MLNITAVWVDERPITRQVAAQWQSVWQCGRILVIDHDAASDAVMNSVLRISSPDEVKLSVLEPEQALSAWSEEKYPEKRIVAALKSPELLWQLVKAGFRPACDITVGVLPEKPGKKKVCRTVYLTERELASFERLCEAGYRILCQPSPADVPVLLLPDKKGDEDRPETEEKETGSGCRRRA